MFRTKYILYESQQTVQLEMVIHVYTGLYRVLSKYPICS